MSDKDIRSALLTARANAKSRATYYPPGSAEREENFSQFLSGSKIRDENGDPLRLYHITKGNFNKFIPGGSTNPKLQPSGPVTWLSPYADHQPAAHSVGGFKDDNGKRIFRSGTNVMPVHAAIKSPLIIDDATSYDWARKVYANDSPEFPQLISAETRASLLANGYDGIVYAGPSSTTAKDAFYGTNVIGSHPEREEEIIALHPQNAPGQIKSAIGNRGTYDLNEADINKAKGGIAEDPAKAIRSALLTARGNAKSHATYYPPGSADGGKAKGGGVNQLYHRRTSSTVDQNGRVGHMMFAADEDSVSHYGKNHYTLDLKRLHPKHVVDAASPAFQRAVKKALLEAPELLEQFGAGKERPAQAVAAQLAAEAAPRDIVTSAGLWDAPELVSHVWDKVIEPNGWRAVKTPNGAISFYPEDTKAAAPSHEADINKAKGGPIDTYHGSPHDFDKFDFSKIGTGEGAQVYGHGLYLADQEAVARQYKMPTVMAASPEINGVKNAKSNYEYFRDGPTMVDKGSKKIVRMPPQSHEAAIKSVYADLTETPEKEHIHRHTLNALDAFVKTGEWPELGEGRLYDVRLHADPESLLDLDRPMAEQSPRVKKALALRPTNTGIGGGPKLYSESTGLYIPDKPDIARSVVPVRDKGAAASMEKAGIPGVRYYDGYSRSKGDGSRNYVVFPTDKDILEITRKRASGGIAEDPAKAIRSALLTARARVKRAEGGEVEFKQDNPAVSRGSTDWLASKQRTAYSDPALLRGAVTGYFKDTVHIPVDMLDGVPGANKENPVPGTYKYDELMKDVKKDGWKPTPILVGVNHKGKPHILEGNHRVAVARALGQTHIPGDIRWWNGGEEVEGDWHPKNVVSRLQPRKRATGGTADAPPDLNQQGFYSNAAQVAQSSLQQQAAPAQVRSTLLNKGVKPDELKWSGFDEKLGSKPVVTRDEVAQHFRDNMPDVQVTQLGGEGRNTSTKFSKETLPGGKNYREVLLHLPERGEHSYPDFDTFFRAKYATYADPAAPAYEFARRDAQRIWDASGGKIAVDDFSGPNVGMRSTNFTNSHWDEPNVLAHVRMSDRKGPNGEKVLHVEEIQSDWGQQAREQGFGLSPEEHAEIEALQKKARGIGGIIKLPQEDRARWEELGKKVENTSSVPRGPYVENTQKWTDLALKHVLHEAAHGGYDRIVFTPGEEQNKRYDLSAHVKNIQYYPDRDYLHAETHAGEGIEHNNVKPDELAKHIGKEAADKILKQGIQRYEGRGKLGGEFYHELEGEGLKVGGEGMRKYYDEIVPSSLQKLAKKHDPQAKVNLHAHDLAVFKLPSDPFEEHKQHYADSYQMVEGQPHANDAELRNWARDFSPDDFHGVDDDPVKASPLHSLDVTPQMRDSIKAKGFSNFKRGGEIESDDPIAHWPWRPLEDVRNQLQLDEIPSHVHKFGEFMDETARRASTKGLTPRDLIKAYAITRSSIGRRALPVETLRASFPELPEGLIGSVRPEGAMGHWLHTKMGQQYLDAAEAGRVDEESIENAHTAMGRFGKDQTEPTALRWAAKNLPGREGRVSELIARAHRGQSSPEEWRGEMRVPGVAASKAGFLASMLGRGDQPTLDARQIILHTGRPTKEAAPILGRKGAANAAVDRLADRQTSLGLKHDPAMSPFYQHLAHHTVWDKAAGEQTTHEDLMHAMRGAKAGGSIKGRAFSDHPLVHAMHAAGLPGLKRGGSAPDDDIVRRQLGSMSPQNLLRRASLSAGHPEQELLAALRQSGPREPKKQGISTLRSPELIERATATIVPNKRIAVTPPPRLSPADLYKRRALIIGGMSDRSGAGYDVSGADDVDFGENISALGGVDYNRMPHSIKNQLGWASARQAISGLATPGKRAEEAGADQVMLTPKLMGLQALDQSHMMMKAASHLLRNAPVTDADAEAFNEHVRSRRPSVTKKKPNPEPHMPDFPGIKHPKLYKYLMNQNMPDRAQLIKAMDAGAWNKKGIPNPAAIRMAFTKPELMRAPTGTPGAFFATFDPNAPHHEDTDPRHPSYEIGLRGENVGGFDRIVPKELMFQKYFDAPENQGRRPTDLMNAYMKKPVSQIADQQWLDRIMPTWEKTPQGWRRGGKTSSIVDRALKLTAKKHG